jgi:hypothetical protein
MKHLKNLSVCVAIGIGAELLGFGSDFYWGVLGLYVFFGCGPMDTLSRSATQQS